ncbi:MAG: hypothetical protein AAB281_06975, partial [Actinomycetota bacterium]
INSVASGACAFNKPGDKISYQWAGETRRPEKLSKTGMCPLKKFTSEKTCEIFYPPLTYPSYT